MTFTASYDRTVKITSLFLCLGFLAVMIASRNIAIICLWLVSILVAYAYSPRRYLLSGGSILVKPRLAGSVRIDLENIREARKATPDDFRGCVRLWGSNGIFGYYGQFRTANLRKSTWYVTNRSNAVVLITAVKTVLFSPDDPDRFLAAIGAAAPITESGGTRSSSPFARRSERSA
jgi:hypothetical protein